jgi:hypothetical protein
MKKETPAPKDVVVVEPVVENTTVENIVADTPPEVETAAYVPQYKILPTFKSAVLLALKDRPYNEVANLFAAINVPTMDHNTLQQVINYIGNFPFEKVEKLLASVGQYVEQIVE